jgi:hypothetical protein
LQIVDQTGERAVKLRDQRVAIITQRAWTAARVAVAIPRALIFQRVEQIHGDAAGTVFDLLTRLEQQATEIGISVHSPDGFRFIGRPGGKIRRFPVRAKTPRGLPTRRVHAGLLHGPRQDHVRRR